MATAKKLPSGSWRCLAYSHTEKILDPKTGQIKNKRIYESFTSSDPSPRGRKEAELAAAEFRARKAGSAAQRNCRDLTLYEAIGLYIDSRADLNRSPTTIQEYRSTQKYAFPDLMEMKLRDLDEDIIQAAIYAETQRPSQGRNRSRPISAKRLQNEWGLVSATIKKYAKVSYSPELPPVPERVPDLIPAKTIIRIIKGTEIELAVLLAAWLSFSMSEVRGLTKSKSISGDMIRIVEVVVDVGGRPLRKDEAKNQTRNRTHRIPPYIMFLINQVDGDVLVPFSGRVLYGKWVRLLRDNNLPHMTFHDLRHLNASIMALLRIPDKYAQERGGWKSDQIMKKVYMQTFTEEREKVDQTINNYFDRFVAETDSISLR